MIIPLHRAHIDDPKAKLLLRPKQSVRSIGLARTKQRFLQLKRMAAGGTRGMFILVGLLAFRWQLLAAISLPIVLAGVLLGCVALALGYTQRLSSWPELLIDSITVVLLIKGTGGAGSPLLALTLVLILQGGLLGGSNGALAGSAAGIATLLMLNLTMRHPINAIVVDLTFLYFVCGFGSSWVWQRASALLSTSFDDINQPKPAAQEAESARPSSRWQRLNLQIAACTTLEQLKQLTASHAATIVCQEVMVQLPSGTFSGEPTAHDGATTNIPIISDGRYR